MMPLGKIAGSASALCRIKIGLEAPLMDGTLPPPCDPGGRWVYGTAKTVPAYIRAGAKSGICCMTCIPSKLI